MSRLTKLIDKLENSFILDLSCRAFVLLIGGSLFAYFTKSQRLETVAWIAIYVGFIGSFPLFVMIIAKLISNANRKIVLKAVFWITLIVVTWLLEDVIQELSFFEKCVLIITYIILSILHKIHTDLLETKKKVDTLFDDR